MKGVLTYRMLIFSSTKQGKRKGDAMYINSIDSNVSHAKSVIKKLRTSSELPFIDILSEDVISKYIEDIKYRNRIFSPDMTIFAFLSQVITEDQSCQKALAQVMAHQARQGKEMPSANTAAYCKARVRLPEEVLSGLAKECAERLESQAKPKWLWRNRHIKLIDGSTVSMPDTSANQVVYPQPDSQRPGIGFPIARIVAVISLAVGAVLDIAVGSYAGKGTGEHALLRQLIHNFNPGDVVLGDRHYDSFFLIALLMKAEVDIAFPINSSRKYDFRKGEKLGKKDHLVQWKKPARPEWMDEKTHRDFPDYITMREVTINSNRAGFRSMSRVMVTTFLDPTCVSKKDLGELYDYRWIVEINLRYIKETMCMDILRGKTPKMVHKEIWAHLLAYNLIRKIMAQSADRYDKRPQELSFKLALQMIFAFRQAGIFSEQNGVLYHQLLKAIACKTIGNRAGRIEPRAVKRRPKAFPKLQMARHLCRGQKNA